MPQYLIHFTVELLPLSEPDKRLSHTSGSSVHHSGHLRPTTRVQVFADYRLRPSHPDQRLVEAFPGVCLALALAVKPFKQDVFCAIGIVAAPLRVIRYGVIAQMTDYACPGLPEHFSLCHYVPALFGPVCELTQALTQLLAAGATFDLEVSFSGLAAIMRKSQKGKLLWFLAPLVGILTGKTAKFDATRLLLGYFQTKTFKPVS